MGRIIEVEHLSKHYGDLEVIRDISFYVEAGSLFAFLGPNGAGKSTTISILSTQITKDAGTVRVDGHRLGKEDDAIRRTIGIVFQENVLDKRLTVEENIISRAGLYGMGRRKAAAAAREAAAAVECTPYYTRRYGRLSGGQRRKADIARALVHMPAVLFLDEPTTGLDPAARRQVWDTIRTLQTSKGITIFLTTHYMEEAAQADYLVVIDHGQVIAGGTPAQIREKYTRDLLKVTVRDPGKLQKMLTESGLVSELRGDEYIIPLRHTADAVPLLSRMGENVTSLEVMKGSMDQAFLNLIGREESKWAL